MTLGLATQPFSFDTMPKNQYFKLPRSVPQAAAVLKSSEVVSNSGRGDVALDAGYVFIMVPTFMIAQPQALLAGTGVGLS